MCNRKAISAVSGRVDAVVDWDVGDRIERTVGCESERDDSDLLEETRSG